MAALLAYPPERAEVLRTITAPTLVIHGDADPLVPLACGVAIAASIPGARLVVIPGMGHLVPPAVFPAVIDQIARHAV
jgi:pimeloyl-ACP methyl ester carboxylesterase